MRACIFLLISVFLFGCTTQNSSQDQIFKDLNISYGNAKSFFGNIFVDHFPKKIGESNITFSEGFSPDMGNLELIVYNKFENNKTSSLTKLYKNKAIAIYKSEDTCLLVVNRFATKDSYYKLSSTEKEKKMIEKECYNNLYPVPNFWHSPFTTYETQCKLPKGYELYVLEAKSGKYFNAKYLSDGWFMPLKWKNGYSKGVAISKENNIIIYWLIIW